MGWVRRKLWIGTFGGEALRIRKGLETTEGCTGFYSLLPLSLVSQKALAAWQKAVKETPLKVPGFALTAVPVYIGNVIC